MSYLTHTGSIVPSTPTAGKLSKFVSSVNLRPYTIDGSGTILNYGTGWGCTTSASAAINTTETIVAGGNAVQGQTVLIPANTLQAGSTIRITLLGTCTSSVANNSTFTGRIGAAGTTADGTLFTAVVAAAASGTAIPFKIGIEFTVRTVGSGTAGTIAGTATIFNQGTTGISTLTVNVIPLSVSGFDTTVQNYFEVTYKSAAVTTTSTFQNGIVEVVR